MWCADCWTQVIDPLGFPLCFCSFVLYWEIVYRMNQRKWTSFSFCCEIQCSWDTWCNNGCDAVKSSVCETGLLMHEGCSVFFFSSSTSRSAKLFYSLCIMQHWCNPVFYLINSMPHKQKLHLQRRHIIQFRTPLD